MAAIAAVGFALRLAYVAVARGVVGGDGRYYHAIAGLVADGKGFIAPQPYLQLGEVIPSAPHPPAWPLVLTGPALVGFRTVLQQQLIAVVIGTATVVLVGLAARQVAGNRAGLVAAAIAAVYPQFWLFERELMSETLVLFGAAAAVLVAYRFRARATLGRAIALGAVCGFVAATRSEEVLLAALLVVPLIVVTSEVPPRQRLGWTAAAVGTMAAFLLPWSVYNTSRFDSPVILGTELGVTLTVANCDTTYSGTYLAFQNTACSDAAYQSGRITGDDHVERDAQLRDFGLDYIRDHIGRVPAVIVAREGRTWSFFRPFQQMRLDRGRGTDLSVIRLAYFAYIVLLPLAVAGVVVLRQRRTTLIPLLAFVVAVSAGTALTYGFTRFRAAAEVPVTILAAVTIDAALTALRGNQLVGSRETPIAVRPI